MRRYACLMLAVPSLLAAQKKPVAPVAYVPPAGAWERKSPGAVGFD